VHTALDCHWLVAWVDCALLGQFLHSPAVDSLLELGATCRSSAHCDQQTSMKLLKHNHINNYITAVNHTTVMNRENIKLDGMKILFVPVLAASVSSVNSL